MEMSADAPAFAVRLILSTRVITKSNKSPIVTAIRGMTARAGPCSTSRGARRAAHLLVHARRQKKVRADSELAVSRRLAGCGGVRAVGQLGGQKQAPAAPRRSARPPRALLCSSLGGFKAHLPVMLLEGRADLG
jgi:hypothetical protein